MTRSLIRSGAVLLGVALISLFAISCGGKSDKSTPAMTTIPKKQPSLSVVNNWWVDDQTHLEPIQVPGVTAASDNTLFIAFIASDSGQGPERGGPPLDGKVQNVEGGNLTWVRRAEAHLTITGEPSIAEIWTAFATTPVQPFTVTVTRNDDNGGLTYCDNYQGGSGPDIANGMVMVQAIVGADPKNPVGATAIAGVGKRSGREGPAMITITTTRPGSLVAAVGADWSGASSRTIPADQVMLHEDRSTPNGDNYWVQGLPSAVPAPGQVTLSVTDPADNDCNMAAIEVLPAP